MTKTLYDRERGVADVTHESYREQTDDRRIICSICKGHFAESATVQTGAVSLKYCRNCLAMTLGRCPSCGVLIPELSLRRWRGIGVYKNDHTLPVYCSTCGVIFPWSTPQQKIYWLENFVDQADVSGEVRLIVGYNLRQLRIAALDERRQLAFWCRVKEIMPGLFNGRARVIIEILLTPEMRNPLGLE